MAGITEDGPHVVTDEWVLGQAGILDVVNDDQVPGQPMFSGPDFLSDHTFSEAMPSERSSATRTDDLSSNASRANRSQGHGSNRPGHDDSVSGRDDDEPGIAPGAQSSSFPELMNIGQSEIRDSRGSSRPVPTSSIAFQVLGNPEPGTSSGVAFDVHLPTESGGLDWRASWPNDGNIFGMDFAAWMPGPPAPSSFPQFQSPKRAAGSDEFMLPLSIENLNPDVASRNVRPRPSVNPTTKTGSHRARGMDRETAHRGNPSARDLGRGRSGDPASIIGRDPLNADTLVNVLDGIEAFQEEFNRSSGLSAQGVRPTPNAASIFALDDMDGANVPIESESMMASSSSRNHTFSNATDIESMSESRVSNATDLNDIVIADSRPDVPMRMDRPVVPKLPVAKGLGMTQPSAVRDARRSAPYQSQSPNRSEFPRLSTAVQDDFRTPPRSNPIMVDLSTPRDRGSGFGPASEEQPNEVADLVTALERGRVDSSVSAIIHRLVAKVEDLGRRNDRSDQCIKQLSTEVNSWRAKYDKCVHVSSTCTQAANAAMQLSQGTKDIVTELGQRVKIVADRMTSVGDALNERASYDDVARSITQVQTVFESLSDRLTGLIARVDMIERSLVESQSNHPAIGGVNLKIEDLSTRMCQIDRMMQDVEQCWTNSRDGMKWIKDQLYETQANLEIKSRDCKSYTDKQNTHNMAVSTTLNSKLEQMLEVLGNTAQRINSLESKYSNQASSSGLNDHTGGRRAG